MCSCCYYSLLLILISLSTMRIMMVTEGLPLTRSERGNYQDIIAGADFLSILMDAPSVRQGYKELTTQLPPKLHHEVNDYAKQSTRVVRRSTAISDLKAFTQSPTTFSTESNNLSDQRLNQSLVISVKVSSSVGDAYINKLSQESKRNASILTTNLSDKSLLATPIDDQIAFPSEDHTSIIAEAKQNPFSINQMEPITSDSYDYVNEFSTNKFKNTVQPLRRHSVIYHDNPGEVPRGRSVSYSAVIQTLPNQGYETYQYGTPNNNRRQERHYDSKEGSKQNQFESDREKLKNSTTSPIKVDHFYYAPPSEAIKGATQYITSTYASPSFPITDVGLTEQTYVSEASSSSIMEFTEKNWEVPEKQYGRPEDRYTPLVTNTQSYGSVVYNKPEDNYEIDESVSLITNGQAHGVQASSSKPFTPTTKVNELNRKVNDSQKVGYVVEGRNYRKYRVEERTSDGFIVGEYGVVSHNDGSLRGVRYTADGTINPRVIYDALMKFLSL